MAAAEPDEAAFRALLAQVARDRGFATANYKDGCLRRRVAVRMRARGCGSYGAYAELLRRDATEYERLVDALTINVTRLYRDAAVWDALAATYLPRLWAEARDGFTAWSAACSSGEEAYTIAALVHREAERTGTLARLADAQVIGTDIDAASLRAAAQGSYAEPAFKEMPPALRTRYFGALPGGRAVPEVRALVRVERRDLLQDPPPAARLQLICCRNVLIYFEREAQDGVFERFHEALAPEGLLVLGKVETMLGAARALFKPVDQRQRIFRKAP